MANQLVSCPHCHGSGWVPVQSTGRRGRPGRSRTQTFETTAAALSARLGSNGFRPAPNGFSSRPNEQGFDPIDQATLSPGESRRSTLYHQWSTGDVWVSALIAGMSGIAVGLPGTIICIAAKTKWYVPLLIWTGATTIVWGLKAKDFFINDKAVVSSQKQKRVLEPAPINVAGPSADIVINSGTTQTRAKLYAPKSNHAGLWKYARALVSGEAAPSYEGGDHVKGAKDYKYTPAEFDGRSDCWRPTAIAGGILELDPHKSKGYRLTHAGKRAMAYVAKERVGEWG